MSIQWIGREDFERNFSSVPNMIVTAVGLLLDRFAAEIEAQAKADAIWTDRTGNARQGLEGFVQDFSETAVALYLVHHVDYGKYLELSMQQRYAIILPTLEQFYQPIMDALQELFN